ncbi:cell surface protein SprA [Cytophagaceae bacterium ABcell3]|nr:cell surface protein SprA [Cytophagaceae bacterium ABcell3]
MSKFSKNSFLFTGIFCLILAVWLSNANTASSKIVPWDKELAPADTSDKEKDKEKEQREKEKELERQRKESRRPIYYEHDREGDPFSNESPESPLLGPKPSNLHLDVELDTTLDNYIIHEKVGDDIDARPDSEMTFEEYSRYKNRQMMRQYWKDKSAGDKELEDNTIGEASLRLPAPGLGSIFGKDFVEIKPNGYVTLDFGGRWQRTQNPAMPINMQRMGGFEFDQMIGMNVVGTIGDKLQLTANWDTKAQFEFQNNLKLEFTGYEEDIIQKIEAGNVSMPLNTQLISGSQNLFGIKTRLQFGRLSVTSIAASQRGQADEIRIEGGSQSRQFELRADKYDENKHFFIGQFFRNNYERSLKTTPVIMSGVKITRLQVYITNRTNVTENTRNMVAYLDLGEANPHKETFREGNGGRLTPADNAANKLFRSIRQYTQTTSLRENLAASGLEAGEDFEIINNARRLEPNREFHYHEDLGYISLNTPLRADEVLAVAYEYTYNGKNYRVGQLQDETQNLKDEEVMILKMLKPSTVRLNLPTWDLMMKNIYQLETNQLTRENFQMRIIYKDDISGADRPNIQEGAASKAPLLRLLGLDQLNPNNDPPADGNFDYIEGVTVDSRYGRIMFPVLEPFGSSLKQHFDTINESHLVNKYIFQELYDMTRIDAEQIASKNKYFLSGRYQSASSSEVMLPGINISPGSVIVTAGSSPLQEGVDYTVDYNMGRLKIINEGVLASGNEIRIRFEKADLVNFRQKYFLGSRFDYRVSDDINFGATILHQSERPQVSRVAFGDEPSANTIWGLDANYASESRIITKIIDKFPLIQTKAPSSVTASGEFAHLIPGYSRGLNLNQDEGGTSYIDDFEGAETPFDLTRTPTLKWHLGATPMRFPEARSHGLEYAYKRARLAWYTVDLSFYTDRGRPDHITQEDVDNHFVRRVDPQEVAPGFQELLGNINEPVLDLAYYPSERGPYNYNPDLTSDGKLKNPQENFGAITRAVSGDIDFDNSNVQYVEFWLMSPYINSNENTMIEGEPFDHNTRGQLYFNLGSISEDVLKDGRHSFENGLPTEPDDEGVDVTPWGHVPRQQYLTNAFDNTGRDRQDVGLDGLSNEEEREFFNDFLNQLPGSARNIVQEDPSGDDFKFFHDQEYDEREASVLERYKRFNGLENNSPTSTGNVPQANNQLPDNEDLNQDNTVNDLEEYYEYRIDIDPNRFSVGQNYIVDQNVQSNVNGDEVTWYLFRIPIREPDNTVGNISGFKSIRFMRMYMTGFEKPIVLRLAKFQMVANQWRTYQHDDINDPDFRVVNEAGTETFTVSSVNIEQHGQASENAPAYTLPPGFHRDMDVTSPQPRELNEQSLSLCAERLPDGRSRAVFKNVNMDFVNYRRLRMFIHAHTQDINVQDEDMQVFIRLGTDFVENYYEISIPLYLTPIGATDEHEVWRSENELDILLEDLVEVKINRDRSEDYGFANTYIEQHGNRTIAVRGRPELSSVQTIMLGIRNPAREGPSRAERSICVWLNELRLAEFQTQNGWAATAILNTKLADVANVTASARYVSAGFGSLDQRISERQRHNTLEYGIASNVSVDKFLPEKLGLKLPFYVSHDRMVITPEFNPLNPDVPMDRALDGLPEEKRADYERFILDQTTRNSWNFTNIQKVKTKEGAKSRIYDIENLTLSFGYSRTTRTNVDIKEYDFRHYRAALGYNYAFTPKVYEPFKKFRFLKSPYFRLIKDFNFSILPNRISVRGDLDRRIIKTQFYEGNPLDGFVQDPFYEKAFAFNRVYAVNWNVTKNLSVDYTANAFALIDEPEGDPDADGYNRILLDQLKYGGRMKDFNQMVALNYKVPFDKIPLTDWIGADVRYSGGYTWTAGALSVADSLGHLTANSRERSINSRINFEKLYNKNKFLKEINKPKPKRRKPGPPSAKKDTTEQQKKELKGLKAGIRSLMSLKTINASFTETEGISLPGFMNTPRVVGLSPGGNATLDMTPFVLGSQNMDIRHMASYNQWLTHSRALNNTFNYSRNQNFNARAALEPFKDLKISVDAKMSKMSNYQEFYRMDTAYVQNPTRENYRFNSENPFQNGSYSATFISIRTAFRDPDQLFSELEQNRARFRARLNAERRHDQDFEGYGLNSQDVLIPAFLATYAGEDKGTSRLSPQRLPLPNWRIDFNGLTRIEKLKDIFPAFTVSHAYQSMYNISNYTSSLIYGPSMVGPNMGLFDPIDGSDMLTNEDGRYIPVFVLDQISIVERFAPLIGVNFRTKSKLSFKLDYTKDRTLTLNMSNSQVTEIRNEGIIFGLGYAKTGMKLPIPIDGNPYTVLKNELTLRLDVAVRNGVTVQRKLDEQSTVTAGNINWQLRPTINYMVNQRLTLQFYFERSVNDPLISTSFKRSTTAFGVQLRFTLS